MVVHTPEGVLEEKVSPVKGKRKRPSETIYPTSLRLDPLLQSGLDWLRGHWHISSQADVLRKCVWDMLWAEGYPGAFPVKTPQPRKTPGASLPRRGRPKRRARVETEMQTKAGQK